MSIVMIMKYPGVSIDEYETVRKDVDFETHIPDGAVLHVATHDGDGLRITDVWESAEHFQKFVDDRLMPAIQRAGIQEPPQVEIHPLHNLFTPGL